MNKGHMRHRARTNRKWWAVAMVAAMGVGSLLAPSPAAAAQDSWVAPVPNNPVAHVYRFTVPASAVQPATGIDGIVVAVEGNFGPGKAWTNLNMGSSGGNWTATIGPLEPGLYYYQYSARPGWNQDAIGFRNPASPQEVASKPTWNTLFVPGPGAESLADVQAGSALEPILYQSSFQPADPAATPWIDVNNVVTFVTGTEFADANNVTVWGNFGPGGSWPRTPMVKQPDGSWRLTLPVEAGSYYYKFVVEGQDRKDPQNPTSVLSEPNWSTFIAPGDGTLRGTYTTPVAPSARGSVEVMNYTSTATGSPERSSYVWTPPGYDPGRAEPYPVLFLQHGAGQTWTDWVEVGFAPNILDNHYLRGTIRPMVVVMSNGNGVVFHNELREAIIPAAEAAYNISSEPHQRALAGLSMGSGHVLTTLHTFPGEFAYVAGFSAIGGLPADADVAAINAGTKLLRIYTGDIQDFTYDRTISLIEAYGARGVNHEFAPVIPGPHSWDVWQKSLIDYLPRLFVADVVGADPS